MLLLTGNDIRALARPDELIDAVERAAELYETGGYTLPDRIGVPQGDNTYLYMPCFTEQAHGTKILTLFPQNPARGLGRIQGVMLLNSPETGAVEAILDGATLTAYRTGAVGSAGLRRTTPEGATTLGLIGAGVQGYHQGLFACRVRPIRQVAVYDADRPRAESTARRFEQELGVQAHVCACAEDAVRASEIVITATASREPVFADDRELVRGRHFIGIGSYKPFMREFPRAVFDEVDEVLIDVDLARKECGDLATPLAEGWITPAQVRTLGKASCAPMRATTLYKSVGMALFDVLVAETLVREARRLHIGCEVAW